MNFAWNYIFKSKLIVNLQFFCLGEGGEKEAWQVLGVKGYLVSKTLKFQIQQLVKWISKRGRGNKRDKAEDRRMVKPI